MPSRASLLVAALLLAPTLAPAADVFHMPPGQTSLQFVTVGDPGNAPDTRFGPNGSVPYAYQIGKYDVTAAQYCQFLNAVATAADPYALYNPAMANPPSAGQFNLGCGITRTGSPGAYAYSVSPASANLPVNWVSWGDAARFANWLSHGQPTGPQGPATTETGAYTLNGLTSPTDLLPVIRNPNATYALPTDAEWYKAAYYKTGSPTAGYWLYPTQHDTPPTNDPSPAGTNNANYYDDFHTGNGGFTDPVNFLTPVGSFASSPGPYGTFDQGGDVWQWNDTVDPILSRRFARGGSYVSGNNYADLSASHHYLSDGSENSFFGFRVAVVPEPTSLLAAGALALLPLTRRR